MQYNKGENVITKEGLNLGQYIEDEKDFIIKDKKLLIDSLLSMGFYSEAINKNNETEKFQIYTKRKIYNEKIGTIEQYLIKVKETLEWKELSDEDYLFIDKEY